jgi:Ca2+-binding RTX toxin-like protein
MALVIGTAAAETLSGGESDDLIVALAGNDTLNGMGGNDTLNGGVGDDLMIGGSGDDLYVADSAADAVGEAPDGGTDTVLAFVTYQLAENSHAETLRLAGALVINGTGTDAAGEVIIGNMAANHLSGLGGADSLAGGFGDDTVEGGAGNDTLNGGQGTDSLVGGAGDDLYVDTLLRTGNSSSGTLSLPGSIVEDVDGGNDTLQVRLAPQRLTFSFPDDSAFTMSRVSSATDPLVGSWVVSGGGEANSTLVITFLADGTFFLAEDGDSIADPSGKDGMERGTYTWDPETGAFSVPDITVNTNGEWGMSSSAPLVLRIDGDSLTMLAADGNTELTRVRSDSNPLVGAWTASNSGEADSTVVITFLGDGSYFLAEDGNRNLDPSGRDGMERGTYEWNPGTGAFSSNTTVNTNGEWGLSHSGTGIEAATSYLAVSPHAVVLADNVDNLDLSSTGALRLDGTGNGLDNVITGNAGKNLLIGGDGDDAINGNAGNDSLEGGAGSDSSFGGAGNDFLGGDSGEGWGNDQLSGGDGNDTIEGDEGGDTLMGGAGNDFLGGDSGLDFGDDLLFGDDGDDTLAGDEGSDTLNGGAGHDRLVGNAGSESGDDVLLGDAGNDTLEAGDGNDTLNGGGGNDVLVWTSGDLLLGGGGTDTLAMKSGNLNLKNVEPSAIQSVEKADLRGDGINVLTVTRSDLLDMSSTDVLTVMGDSNDRVNAAGFARQGTSGGFLRYTSGAATLLVESDVTVVT